jgi:hypothetical protein
MTASQRQLFIVGLPRSGTTLLRNLLHGHQQISLTAYESHFVPALLERHGARPRFDRRTEAQAFVAKFKRGLLYQKGLERGVFCPTDAELEAAMTGDSWPVVLRNIFNLYCDKDMAQTAIWGDKTPSYASHIDRIGDAMPEACFLHIIRDPRDQALSERAIWGKSLRRSADMWRQIVYNARESRVASQGRYMEVTYEALASRPRSELQRLSSWLGLDFQPAMLESAGGSDELGQMIGAQAIEHTAIGGRREHLRLAEERVIAELAGGIARSLNYDLPSVPARKVRPAAMRLLAAHDRATLVAYFIRQKGLVGGLRSAAGALADSRAGGAKE